MGSMPNRLSSPFTIPSVENMAKQRVNTTIQLMKLGRVVKVCTSFRNFDERISLMRMAKMTGSGDPSIPRKLRANVFLSTRITSARFSQIA